MPEDTLAPTVIDLGMARRGEMNESSLVQFGSIIQTMLNRMFGASGGPLTIRGTRGEIGTFAGALAGEKKYMRAYQKYGLDDPRVLSNKYKLDSAVRKFEQESGIKWPIK